MKLINPLSTLICFTLIACSANTLASTCSKADIDHYLKSGFTHDQVIQLCTSTATPQSSGNLYQSISKPVVNTAPAVVANSGASHSASTNRNEDQIYLETVIEGNPVTLSGNQLSFDRKECAVYGDVNLTGFRDKACLNTRTTIDLKGLKIIRATKAIFLIKEQELLVKGHITRKYLNTSGLNKYKMEAINKQLPTQPKQLNIPIKKGIDPKVVAGKLKKYQ